PLTLDHTGQGTDPTASPPNSTGCSAGQYHFGESIALSGAVPDEDWKINGWTGTTNNSSIANTNTVTMPASAHTATVIYGEAFPTCYTLTLSHTGSGADPIPSPTKSPDCTTTGQYIAGQPITLTASPDTDYQVASWTGTVNNSSTAIT